MFGPHGSVGSHHCRLDVAKDGVDPFEARVFGRFRSAAGLDRRIGAPCRCHGGKAAERIGHGVNARIERRARNSGHRSFAEPADAAKHDLIGFAIAGHGNGSHERRLPRPSAPVWSMVLPADIGIVHLHFAFQAPGRVALDHDLGELVLEGPGGCLRDAEPAPELDAGNAFLGLGREVHGLEPEPQRQLAGREDRSGRDGCLFAAGIALVQNPGTAFDDAVIRAGAVRTFETPGPARPHQRAAAKRFGSVQTVK